jgi:hypothetical protein
MSAVPLPPAPRTLADVPLPSRQDLVFALAMGLVWGVATVIITLLTRRVEQDVRRDIPED